MNGRATLNQKVSCVAAQRANLEQTTYKAGKLKQDSVANTIQCTAHPYHELSVTACTMGAAYPYHEFSVTACATGTAHLHHEFSMAACIAACDARVAQHKRMRTLGSC